MHSSLSVKDAQCSRTYFSLRELGLCQQSERQVLKEIPVLILLAFPTQSKTG